MDRSLWTSGEGMISRVFFCDIECDGLLDELTKIHCLSTKKPDDDPFTFTDNPRAFFENLLPNDVLVFHNGHGYDLEVLKKLKIIDDYSILPDSITVNGVRKEVQLIDTLVWSRKFWPDMPQGHGLEAWAKRLGAYKPQIDDWENLSIEEYIERAEEDTITTEAVFKYLCDKLGVNDVADIPLHLKLASKTYALMQEQERTGILFDQDKAKKLVRYIDRKMARIEELVEPLLPERPLNKTEIREHTPPKLQFKKDGTPSAACLKWFEKVTYSNTERCYIGKKAGKYPYLPHHEPIITSLPMKLKHQQHMKDWLMREGWKPVFYNFKKDARGRPVRDERGKIITTSPKFHENGEICPDLIRMGSRVKLIKLVVKWLSLRNRRSVLINEDKGTGWLNHPRLKVDGRLPAASSGLANTFRQKHRTVANIPRVTSLLGKRMRELFCAPPDKVFVGYDASGLEARVEAERSFKYDNGLYAAELLEGDIHSKNAKVFGTDRDGAKSPKYAITYGCAAPKLAGLLGCTTPAAQQYIDNYWETNYSVGQHRQTVISDWKKNGKKYITGVLGDKIVTRSEHSLLNADFQNFGAVVMDIANAFMDKWVKQHNIPAKRVVFYHDEAIWECFLKDAELISELGVKSIKKAGEYLKMNIELDADAKVGYSWKEVH